MLISKSAFLFYTVVSLILLVSCGPLGPFLSYFVSFSASSIGLIISTGDKNAVN